MIPGSAHRREQTGVSRIDQDLSIFHQQNGLAPNRSRMLRSMATRFAIKRQPHVCIVGAGVAGLRCADILLQQGIKVTIYEARNRIGGRVRIQADPRT